MEREHPGGISENNALRPAENPLQAKRSIRGWAASWIPSSFVAFSLLLLLAVPIWRERRIAEVSTDVLEPAQDARGVINDLRQAFSEAESSYRGYMLTGDARFLSAMAVSHSDQTRALAELEEHAAQLGPGIVDMVGRLRAHSVEARERRHEAVSSGMLDPAIAAEDHRRLLSESEIVRGAIIEQAQRARARIQALNYAGAIVTLGLGSLTLAAALLVIALAQRDRRKAKFETELRTAALTLAEATDLSDILSRIATSAARTVTGASTFVERIDDQRGDIEVVTAAGTHVLAPGTRFPLPGSLTRAALKRGTTEVFRVASMSERPSAAGLRKVCSNCAGVVIPLISANDPQGALVLLRPGQRDFRPREIAQLRIFGAFAAMALRKGVLLARAVEQRREVQHAAKARERLVRGFSHDLKNPLGAADGYAALLEEGIHGALAPEQREHVQRIRGLVRRALDIVDDVVELARAESGQLPIRQGLVRPDALVRELAHEYKPLAGSARLELITDVPDELSTVETDSQRVRQIVGNLISNAIKYTPPGGRITLVASVEEGRRSGDPHCWLTVAVADTGPGIPADDLPRLFREFQRLDKGSVPGAGLGLAISQRVAGLLGGEITVNSEVGSGSTFTLWLPCKHDQQRASS